jgi:hypothetical protein
MVTDERFLCIFVTVLLPFGRLVVPGWLPVWVIAGSELVTTFFEPEAVVPPEELRLEKLSARRASDDVPFSSHVFLEILDFPLNHGKGGDREEKEEC